MFGDAEQHQPAQIVVQLLELERDKPQRSLVLAPSEVRELRTLLASDAPRFGEPQDAYLAEDVRCCREDLSNWLEAHEHTSDPIMVARHL